MRNETQTRNMLPAAAVALAIGGSAVLVAGVVDGCARNLFGDVLPHGVSAGQVNSVLERVQQVDDTLLDTGSGRANAQISKCVSTSIPALGEVLCWGSHKEATVARTEEVQLFTHNSDIKLRAYPLDKSSQPSTPGKKRLPFGVEILVNSQGLYTSLANPSWQFNSDGSPTISTNYGLFAIGDGANLLATAETAADHTYQNECGHVIVGLAAASIKAHERTSINSTADLVKAIPGQRASYTLLKELATGPMYVQYQDYGRIWNDKQKRFVYKTPAHIVDISPEQLTETRSYTTQTKDGSVTVHKVADKHLSASFAPELPNKINTAREASSSPSELLLSNNHNGCLSTSSAVKEELVLANNAQLAVTKGQ